MDDEEAARGLTVSSTPSTKRERDPRVIERTEVFDWSDISLPLVTRLRFLMVGENRYIGGAAFLTAHTALLQLDVSTLLVSVDELTAVLSDCTALPQLTHLGLHEHRDRNGHYNAQPLLTALATTVVGVTGRPRPITWLHLRPPKRAGPFLAAVALLPSLATLHIDNASLGWLREWTEIAKMSDVFLQLNRCIINSRRYDASGDAAGRLDVLLFLQSVAASPLRLIDIDVRSHTTFDAAALAQLARCHQLRSLGISVESFEASEWMDWRDGALFAAFTAGCLSNLRHVTLSRFKLSAASLIAIASAAPQLHVFLLYSVELSCHPAVVCAVFGGYCAHIEHVTISDDERRHVWRDVHAADVVNAYQSAVAATGRGSSYTPYTELRSLCVPMCWCTPPSVWHALLSLLRHAEHIQRAELGNNDPLAISALAYLPSLTCVGPCAWPLSAVTFVQRRLKQSEQFHLNPNRDLCGRRQQSLLRLHDSEHRYGYGLHVLLRPHSDLFAAFQRSFSDEQQTVLARWAAGDFRAGDEQVSAAECDVQSEDEAGSVVSGGRHCKQPCPLYTWHREPRTDASDGWRYTTVDERGEFEAEVESGSQPAVGGADGVVAAIDCSRS